MQDDIPGFSQCVSIAHGIIQGGISLRVNMAMEHEDHRKRPFAPGNIDEPEHIQAFTSESEEPAVET